MSSTSHRTGADTAAPAEAYGVGDFAETTTVRSADSAADTAAPNWHGGSGSLVAAPASGDVGYGLAGVTGSCSEGLEYDSVFFLWQVGPRGKLVP